MRKRTVNRVAPLAVLVVLAVACGDDGGGDAATTIAPTTAAATTVAPATTAAPVTTAAPLSLKAAGCPDPLVVQTDWFPEVEHGGTYQLIGPNGTQDPKNGKYSGPLGDITLEIRAGGPFIGQDSATQQFYKDPSIFMAYVSTDDAIKSSGKLPVVAVMAPLEKSPQIIMWDPAKFPDVKTLQDVGTTAGSGKVLYFSGGAYMDFLIGTKVLKPSQIDSNYDGSPSRFVSEGDIFQQGYVTNEVYKYEVDIAEWRKPVAYALVHDAGWEIYQSALSVKPETITEKAECLKALVPLMQQGFVDYFADPAPINAFVTKYVTAMDQFWQLSDPLNDAGTKKMLELGLVSNGTNSVLGDMDCARVDTLITKYVPILAGLNIDTVKAGVACADVANNTFLDQTIGL